VPVVALVTAAGIIALGLAVLVSWALLIFFLLILQARAVAHRLPPRAALRLDRTQPIARDSPKNRPSRLSTSGSRRCRMSCP
jgi:hypothetical protein